MNTVKVENHPELRSWPRFIFEGGFTSMMWAVWIYLFLPLLSVLMWAFGFRTFYAHVFKDAALSELYALLGHLGLAVLFFFVALRAWELYNFYHFGRRNRRKRSAALTPDDVSRHFGVPADEITALQAQKEIVWSPLYEDMVAGSSGQPRESNRR